MSNKKNILLFIDWYLPGYKAGGPIQSCANLVDHLKSKYNFYIVTRDTDYCETQPYSNVKSNSWNKLSEGVNVFYYSAAQLSAKNIFRLLKTTKYDAVYLNGVFSYYFTIVPLLFFRNKRSTKIILATRGMLALGALSIKSKKKTFFLNLSKILGLYKNITFHATNNDEKNDILQVMGSNSKVLIAGNLPKKINRVAFINKEKKVNQLKLVNVARIAPEKNLKFALSILKESKDNIEFDFYGPIYNNEYYEQCKAIMNNMPANVIVKYKGVLPNSLVNSTLANYHCMFMPTLGENFGHIILEALMAACPVIISDKTPWQNLRKDSAGWDISLENKTEFLEVIHHLAQTNSETFNHYALAAFNKAKQFSDNEELISSNMALFD